MESVLRGIAIYVVLLLVFRIAGKRTLAQQTSFDLVLLLIISETTQQAMLNGDESFLNAVLLIVTLVGMTIFLSFLKMKFPAVDKWIEGTPVIVLEYGKPKADRMQRERVDERDILAAARSHHGIERMDQIKYAVVEVNGEITIVPKEGGKS